MTNALTNSGSLPIRSLWTTIEFAIAGAEAATAASGGVVPATAAAAEAALAAEDAANATTAAPKFGPIKRLINSSKSGC